MHATARSATYSNVAFESGDIRSLNITERHYDLIVVADVLYYAVSPAEEPALANIAERIAACLAPGGLLLLSDHYFLGFDTASRRTRIIHSAFRRVDGRIPPPS